MGKVTLLDTAGPSLSVDPASSGTSSIKLADIAATQGGGVNTDSRGTTASGTFCGSALFHRVGGTGGAYVWVTVGLTAVTISGTITSNLWMSESNMSANAGAGVGIWQCQNDGTFINLILGCRPFSGTSTGTTFEKGTELPVGTRAAQNWTGTPTSRTLSNGDRICISTGVGAVGTMAGGHTCDFGWDGATGGSDGDSFVTFTETLTEFVGASVIPDVVMAPMRSR